MNVKTKTRVLPVDHDGVSFAVSSDCPFLLAIRSTSPGSHVPEADPCHGLGRCKDEKPRVSPSSLSHVYLEPNFANGSRFSHLVSCFVDVGLRKEKES